MTKTAFRCVQIVLLFYGVFGADEDDVSVIEGDSVTLNPLTQIKTFNLIEWKFGDPIIAKTDGNYILYPNHTEIFRGRLQLDQTGSLTIKNMKTKHSGLYQLQISHDAGTAERKFSVTVYESPSVIDAGKAEMKSVSVMSGDHVTLQTGVTLISGEELIVWRFGDEGKLIAKADIEAKSSPLYYDERFRDRLELNKTGSLIITDTRTTDSGFYSVKISSRTQTVYKRLSVSVSEPGLSPGAVAGIVLLVLAAAAAAVVGFIYYRRKISELQKQIYERKRVFVTEGESVHLSTDRPKIERDDVIQWRFGDEIIAEVKGGTGKIHDGADGRFRDRLQLNDQTGDLTIKSSTDEDEGYYNLKIISRKGNTDKTYSVIIPVRRVFVTVGESVHLSTDRPKIERDDEIQWRCGDEIIAEIKEGTGETHDGAAGRFRDRLQLNDQNGDLTIKNSTAKDAGDYKLKIRSSEGNTDWTYSVIITGRHVTVGESVHLSTDRPKIERDDEIQWRFRGEIIAEVKGGTGKTHDGAADGRFRDRLELDKITGDLTIKNSTDEDEGYYKLNISSSKGNRNKNYMVRITDKPREKSPVKGNNGKRVDESASVVIPLLDK